MRKDNRRLGYPQRSAHSLIRYVREIDQHTEPIHLTDDLFANDRQAPMLRFVAGGIGPISILCVSQRHISGSEFVHHAQSRQRVIDRMPAFEADQPSDFSGAMDPLDIGGREGQLQCFRVRRDEPIDDVDLLQGRLNCFRAR